MTIANEKSENDKEIEKKLTTSKRFFFNNGLDGVLNVNFTVIWHNF